MPDINDLVGFAIDKNPIDFADAFNAVVREKAAAAIENKRIEISQSIYGSDEEQDVEDEDFVPEDDDTDNTDDIDDEGDEFDLDDLDLDELDIDLNDLDLEDNEDTDEDA